jgi:Uma2 family endonuclease
MATWVERRRFNVHDYHCMAEAGILLEDDRVELIDGEIVEMSPIGSRHAACVSRLVALLTNRLGSSAVIFPQNPVRLGDFLEPQPDIAVLRPRTDYYASALPGPADVLLLVEVAETSLRYDREVKLPLYSATGIQEVWIVDLVNERIEQYGDPKEGIYRTTMEAQRGMAVRSVALPLIDVDVDSLLS